MSTIHSAATTEALRRSWLAPAIETYVASLRERRASDAVIKRRVPLLLQFGAFAQTQGATRLDQLPALIGAFVDERIQRRVRPCSSIERLAAYSIEVRLPVEQLLVTLLPELRRDRCLYMPSFFGQAVGFFEALREERGLRDATIQLYRTHLARFEQFLDEEGIGDLEALLPVHLDRFVAAARSRLCLASLPALCTALRLLFRWLYGRDPVETRELVAARMVRLNVSPRRAPRAPAAAICFAADVTSRRQHPAASPRTRAGGAQLGDEGPTA